MFWASYRPVEPWSSVTFQLSKCRSHKSPTVFHLQKSLLFASNLSSRTLLLSLPRTPRIWAWGGVCSSEHPRDLQHPNLLRGPPSFRPSDPDCRLAAVLAHQPEVVGHRRPNSQLQRRHAVKPSDSTDGCGAVRLSCESEPVLLAFLLKKTHKSRVSSKQTHPNKPENFGTGWDFHNEVSCVCVGTGTECSVHAKKSAVNEKASGVHKC